MKSQGILMAMAVSSATCAATLPALGNVDAMGSAEPPKADDPLLKARNIIVTPHIAWATGEARARLLETVRANLAAWLRGEKRNALT